nr:CAZy families GH28 protein [uncultured Bacteroides sp.]
MSPKQGVFIEFSKNISVSGITFINPTHYTIYGGQSTSLNINNIKSFSCERASDGVDIMSCSDVIINNVF